MNATLLRGLVALMPACVLLSGSIILFSKGKAVGSFLQLLGAGKPYRSRTLSYLRRTLLVSLDELGA